MRVGNYSITADGIHQFVVHLVKINTVEKNGVKGPNYGEEQLSNPSFHTSWYSVLRKLAELELMSSVNELSGIGDVQELFTLSLMQIEDDAIKQIDVSEKMYKMLENAMCLLAENDKECKALSKEIRLLRAEARGENNEHSD